MTEKHENDPAARVTLTQPGLVVRPGDTLVLVVRDGDVTADDVAEWTAQVKAKVPAGVEVLFVGGVDPLVIRGDGRCREMAERSGWMRDGADWDLQCLERLGHTGPHHAKAGTTTVTWSGTRP